MFIRKSLVEGKHWIETEAILLLPDRSSSSFGTFWKSTLADAATIHWLTLSSGAREATIPFPSTVLRRAKRDKYVQRRIRYRLKKTLRDLFAGKA